MFEGLIFGILRYAMENVEKLSPYFRLFRETVVN